MNDTGEVAAVKELLNPAPEAEPTETEETPTEAVTDDAQAPITDDVEDAIADEIALDSEEESTEEITPKADPEYAEDVQTIAQLAEAIEVTPDYLYKIKIGMGDNQEAIPIGELKDKYTESLNTAKTLQNTIDEQASQIEQNQGGVDYSNQVSQERMNLQIAQAKLNDQYNEIDWVKYEEQDAGGAALAKQKFQEASNNIMNQSNHVRQQEQQMHQQMLQQGASQLMEIIPEWRDESVRVAEQQEVAQLLVGAGYTQDQVAMISDPVAISLARELFKLRAEHELAKASISKVNKAPKVLRNRGKFTAKPTKMFDEAKAKARKTGDKNDELAAVKLLLAGKG